MQADESARPPAPPLQLPDWDPATSYVTPQHQVRMPPALFDRLQQWAKASSMSTTSLVNRALEDAVRLRKEAREAMAPTPAKPI